MVGMMAAISRDKIASGIKSVKYCDDDDVASKLYHLRRLQQDLSSSDYLLLGEFISPIIDLLSDRLSPIRKFVTQLIGQIGLKHFELLSEIIPALVDVLKDDSPAVARQAIACGIDIFRCSLVKVAIQGLYSSEFNESLKSSWEGVLKFRDEIYSMAFKAGSDGQRLPALKFVESVVLLYTPDPNGSLEPPSGQISEGSLEEFNVSWLRGGHPILDVGDLSVEASRSLGVLLDQLRIPSVKSNSNLLIIVLIKSLSSVARKRPSFYGRILPVLLGLDPSSSSSNGMNRNGVHHALKSAFKACLDCSHSGAAPWRDRLVSALTETKVARPTQAAKEICQENDEKSSIAHNSEHVNAGRKRAGVLDATEDESPGKRARSSPDAMEGSGLDMSGKLDRNTSNRPTPTRSDVDSGPIQQLVTMFSALAAQGEQAVASLEILISSISADLIAEVVMANMRNLSPNCVQLEGDGEALLDMGAHPGMIASVTHLKQLSLLLKDMFSQTQSFPGKEPEIEECHHSVSSELKHITEEEPQVAFSDSSIAHDGSNYANLPVEVSISESVSAEDIPSAMETSYTANTSEANDLQVVENEIPGLTLPTQHDGIHESIAIFSMDSTDLDDIKQEKSISVVMTPLEITQPLSMERSEDLSPKEAATDATSISSSTANSGGLFAQFHLPKISAPVIDLADEEKDQLQELAFVRIVDAYKQVTVAGGSQARFSILAHSGLEFPSELDPWKFLKTHILLDYVNHEGHELTLRVLYRLFGEAEEDRDFFSSTTATSVYETFLLQVAETLRDSFPASDKSLSRLLGEVPYLPKSLFEMLERLCSPGTNDNDDKELHGGDRVTQGLSTVWSLILLRPPIRDACLKITLKSAVHHLDEVRMKAIRLVANKLYPLSSISGKIEEFAEEMLMSVAKVDPTALAKEADGTHDDLHKEEYPSSENQSTSSTIKDVPSDTHQLSASESITSATVAEVQRCMSLYFALCTKKHSLLRQIFDVYKGTSTVAKQAVHGQIPLLVRTIGSSRDLLNIISDPPSGSEELVIKVVQTLTDGTVPSPELISTIKRLYDTKLKDVDILVPILPFLPKDEVLLLFPHLVNTPMDKFQVVLSRVLQGLNHSTPVLTPAEALIAILGIDPVRDGIPLKKVTEACNACFEQRLIFTQPVVAKVLNHLVEQIPLPLLFMRIVLQAIGVFPSLVEFIMEILSRLVSKQIWKNPQQWVGFMKCALMTRPQSFGALLQLPSTQLEIAMNRTPALKDPLVAHASQPHIRSSLPRSTLVVLGIVTEAQTSTQIAPAQIGPVQTSDDQIAPAQSSTQTVPGQSSSQTAPGQSSSQTAPGQSSSQTAPDQSSLQIAPAQSSSQTAPDQSSPQTAPAQSSTLTGEETSLSEKEVNTPGQT